MKITISDENRSTFTVKVENDKGESRVDIVFIARLADMLRFVEESAKKFSTVN